MKNPDPEQALDQKRKAPSDPRREDPKPDAAPLDIESLDLSVENVEERISPRETNVFDK
ncbi:MAG: hypothetical protein AAFZ65_01565 [Planctomycetota bacterium]